MLIKSKINLKACPRPVYNLARGLGVVKFESRNSDFVGDLVGVGEEGEPEREDGGGQSGGRHVVPTHAAKVGEVDPVRLAPGCRVIT